MKESISTTVLFIIVITLVILFTGVVSFSTNRNNAFAVKDKIVSTIEEYGYFDLGADLEHGNDKVLSKIVDVVNDTSYRQVGNCDSVVSRMYNEDSLNGDVQYTSYTRDGKISSSKSSFCIIKIKGSETGSLTTYYYKVVVFYNLDIPVVNTLFDFSDVGETKALYK